MYQATLSSWDSIRESKIIGTFPTSQEAWAAANAAYAEEDNTGKLIFSPMVTIVK